jgi:hypothetical protein
MHGGKLAMRPQPLTSIAVEVRAQKDCGKDDVKEFPLSSRLCKLVSRASEAGIAPPKELLPRFKSVSCMRAEKDSGIAP